MNLHHLLKETYAFLPPEKTLADLTEQDAFHRVESGSVQHSIAEIVAHMEFWQSWFLRRCRGESAPMVEKASLGWPAVLPGTWNDLRLRFLNGLEEATALSNQEGVLVRPVDPPIEFPPLAEYTIADALAHVAFHNGHHLGQIITLRQVHGNWPPAAGSWTW